MNENECTDQLYPCQFPIKVIGEQTENLQDIIIQVMASLGEQLKPEEMSTKPSAQGKYLSITFRITAQSREHIEHIYATLKAHEAVRMVL